MMVVDCGTRKIEIHDKNMYLIENGKRTLLENSHQLTNDETERLYMLCVIMEDAVTED